LAQIETERAIRMANVVPASRLVCRREQSRLEFRSLRLHALC
jgi:hypothetical protein